MNDRVSKAYLTFLLIILLPSSIFSANSQLDEEAPVMVGYSRNYMFPLLDGGILHFEDEEELWAMAIDKPTYLTLISPTGEEAGYYLEPLKQVLIKKFTENDVGGQWLLKTKMYNLTIQFSVKKLSEEPVRLNYRLDADKLITEIADKEQEAFIIDVEDGRFLIPAGVEVSIDLPRPWARNNQNYSDVVMDLVYPREFTYQGELADRPYSITMEPIAARIVGKLNGSTLTLVTPDLHKVGPGGIVPVRKGEAILKIRYVSTGFINSSYVVEDSALTEKQIEIYVVNDVFNEWVGEKAAKKLSLNVEEALNKTLRIIASSSGEVKTYYALIPLTSIVFCESRLGRTIGNLSLIVEGSQVTVKNDKAYILLANSESTLMVPVKATGTTLIVHAYVNGFKTYSGRIQVNRGETHSIPVDLHNLIINLFFPNGSLAQYGELKINGLKKDFVNGSASYLLPTGSYSIEFSLNEWFGRATIQLHEDTYLRIDLTRHLRVIDILRIIAVLESTILAFISILIIRLRRRH